MTTIAAVKKGKRLCIASDSLTLFGSRKELSGQHVYGEGKFIRVGSNYIGMAGHPSWELILKHYFARQKRVFPWKTAEQIFEIFRKMHSDLKRIYYLSSDRSDFSPFEDSAFELLIVNPYGIFEVEYSRLVRQYSKFSAIGSGEYYALGAMKAVYDELNNPGEIVGLGIKAAAQFDRGTELPLHICWIDSKAYS